MKPLPIIKIAIIVATVGYLLGFVIQAALIANHNMWNEAREAAAYPYGPTDEQAAVIAQQELKFLRSEIEQEKTALVKYQQASYEALQEAEALRARVDALKIELKGRK